MIVSGFAAENLYTRDLFSRNIFSTTQMLAHNFIANSKNYKVLNNKPIKNYKVLVNSYNVNKNLDDHAYFFSELDLLSAHQLCDEQNTDHTAVDLCDTLLAAKFPFFPVIKKRNSKSALGTTRI